MHLPLISFLTELWHLFDLSAVVGHGVVLAALLFKFKLSTRSGAFSVTFLVVIFFHIRHKKTTKSYTFSDVLEVPRSVASNKYPQYKIKKKKKCLPVFHFTRSMKYIASFTTLWAVPP